jgi:ribulose-phosphate 3-epimerase
VHRSLQAIRALGRRAGVTLNPATPIETIENVIDLVDLILIMSVNPGFGGQAFIPAALDKIARARSLAGAGRSTSRSTAASRRTMPRRSRAPAPTCWSPARPCSRAAGRLRANIAAIRNAPRWRAGKRRKQARRATSIVTETSHSEMAIDPSQESPASGWIRRPCRAI